MKLADEAEEAPSSTDMDMMSTRRQVERRASMFSLLRLPGLERVDWKRDRARDQ